MLNILRLKTARRAMAGFAAGLLLFPAGCSRSISSEPERSPVRYVIGISPFLDDAVKDDVYRRVIAFVLEDVSLGSSVWLYDAFHLRTIAHVQIPHVRAFRSGRTRANQFKDELLKLRDFLADAHAPPELAGIDFTQALRVPQFLDFVGENLAPTNRPVVVVLLGGPLYVDEKEPGFSMVDGYFPSDGHLMGTREQSVFGLKEKASKLEGIPAHFGYFGDPWVSEVHQEKVSRFWTLYLKKQGGRLETFCGDLPTLFNALRTGGDGFAARNRQHEIDAGQTKIEMLRITRDVGVADWITRDIPASIRQAPPRSTVGPMKIGIRWQGDIDLDLYARPGRTGERLYFEHTRSPEGYYFRDHRSSPEREFEFIEFLNPVDVWNVEAMVNFYEGAAPGGPGGEIRIEFEGKLYTGSFALGADQGNRGAEGPAQNRFWSAIDVPRILKLR